MLITPAPPGVVVVPLVLAAERPQEGAPAWEQLPPVELSRVPCAHEWLALGGTTYRVLGVRHLSGDIAAELHCERLPALPERGETAATLSEVSGAER